MGWELAVDERCATARATPRSQHGQNKEGEELSNHCVSGSGDESPEASSSASGSQDAVSDDNDEMYEMCGGRTAAAASRMAGRRKKQVRECEEHRNQ